MAEWILSPSFSGPTVDPDHPWLGLHPFAEENHRYFFGRTAEVRDIFLRVRENPLTVLYGQSGLGKTSLLRAGLIPKLRVERFRPVCVLLDFGEKSVPLVDQVRNALAAACADPGGDVATLIERWAPLAGLWEICAHETIRPRDLADKPPVLIIDQLEEVFTLAEQQVPAADSRRAEVAELFAQIGDLVENRAPIALQKTFNQDPRLALAYDSSPTAVRVALSLREDYLAQLEQWKSAIPSLMRNRMPLRLLTGPQAFEAVVRPGRIDGRNLISDRAGEQIVRFVAKRPDNVPLEEIEAVPPLLSLVCERLNTARLEAKPPQEGISDQLVKLQGTDILLRFYDESFAAFPNAQREMVREYVEDRMVTVGGHRNPVAREDAVAELLRQGVSEPDNVLNALIARRLLTAERRGGIQRLEITHDVLTPLAVRGRKDRQERRDLDQAKRKQAETEAQLVRETELREEAKRKQLEAEFQLARETRLRNLFRLALAGVTLVLILALGALLWAVQEKNRADKVAKIAEEKTKEAKEQATLARAAEKKISEDLNRVANLLVNMLTALRNDQNSKENEARRAYEEVLKIYREMAQAQKEPESYLLLLGRVLHDLAMLDDDQKRPEGAWKEYEEALKIFHELAQKNPGTYLHELTSTLELLGLLDWRQKRMEEARKAYEEALKIYRKLAQQNKVADLLNDLGALDRNQNRPEEAHQAFEEALKIFRELAQKDPANYLPNLGRVRHNLGQLNRDQNRPEEALQAFEEALKIFRELAQKNPGTYLYELTSTLENLGLLDWKQNRMEKARNELAEALKTRRELAEKNSQTYLPDVAETLNDLGKVNRVQNRMEEAGKAYEEALKIRRQLAQKNPDRYLPDVAETLNNLGVLDCAQKRTEESWKELDEALQIRRELAKKNPEAYLPEVAETFNNLGTLNRGQNRMEEARKELDEALEIRREMAEKNPQTYLSDVAETLDNLGVLNCAQKRTEESWKELDEALQIRRELAKKNPEAYLPEVAETLINMGELDRERERINEVRKELDEALRIYEPFANRDPEQFSPYVTRVKKLLEEVRQ